ncbi:hypothetical protein Tco_0607109, partial [Tanacetum coccineum]
LSSSVLPRNVSMLLLSLVLEMRSWFRLGDETQKEPNGQPTPLDQEVQGL